MTLNRIQFQRGLSIPAFLSRYGSEAQCVEALVQARWPDGFVCPQCGHTHVSRFERGHQQLWQCVRCRVQTSLTAGTPMADTKLPLRVWWLAIYLVSQAKNGVAALELARQLGVCYRTAWRIKHKVMSAMADREQSRRLDGEVQIDDAYLGGERAGGPGEPQWRNKVPFIAAVSLHQGRPRYLRLDVVSSFRRSVVHTWAQQALTPGTHVVSDGLTAFTGVSWAGLTHDAIVTGSGRKGAQQPRLRWVNTILGNLKTALSGTHHAVDFPKYGARYLHAHAYRFNRRFNLAAMVPRLARALAGAGRLTEQHLRTPAETQR
ncbi:MULTISPECIES: IS1595 family transposase [unclassified Xanthomonas]|uniref:IS1595 family transposase n=1 Tax=Xanthomonas sp. LMG 9002 TaxID=1591158 RepID=UPI00136CAD97|nr:IS1595 family transposase [Xanthomonas sp. LMG 9002]MXV07536.1 IS1595 family transposase [Xanthomonas sp. LMG 9002]